MTRRAVSTEGAPAAVGPYSQGIVVDGLLFCAGQAALDPATGNLVDGGIEPETERVMASLTAVLDAALDEVAGRRVERGLAGAEQQPVDDDALAVRSHGGRCTFGRDGAAGHTSLPSA